MVWYQTQYMEKLAMEFNDFCYQLCHSTPWGFDMDNNMNAVKDVIRGKSSPWHRFFIFYGVQLLCINNAKHFDNLLSFFLEVIVLLEARKEISIRKLLKRK